MTTIPLPIPVPRIIIDGDVVTIDRSSTELAKSRRLLGELLTVEDNQAVCSSCGGTDARMATYEPPPGFRWGGCFCGYCLGQGVTARRLGLIIDQITCDIIPVVVFDKDGIPRNISD